MLLGLTSLAYVGQVWISLWSLEKGPYPDWLLALSSLLLIFMDVWSMNQTISEENYLEGTWSNLLSYFRRLALKCMISLYQISYERKKELMSFLKPTEWIFCCNHLALSPCVHRVSNKNPVKTSPLFKGAVLQGKPRTFWIILNSWQLLSGCTLVKYAPRSYIWAIMLLTGFAWSHSCKIHNEEESCNDWLQQSNIFFEKSELLLPET